ncbi:thioredoxin family protein [Xanthobacter autotrophicus]|uniref:thioredoxin family protein n=1 Tax=Xanthobacter autotrophicus TaxID=280 RepID=UPI00372786E6
MFTRRATLAFSLGAALVAGVSAMAFAAPTHATFTPAAFQAAQHAGKPILVEIHASWCPVCAAQAPILSELLSQPRFKDMVVFRVDFDSQKDAVKSFNARSQSTLITFKGTTEAGRSVGDTHKGSIETLLSQAI